MKQVGYVLTESDVSTLWDQRWYKKDKREVSVRYYFELQDGDFAEKPIYRWIITDNNYARQVKRHKSSNGCWLSDEDPTAYLGRIINDF